MLVRHLRPLVRAFIVNSEPDMPDAVTSSLGIVAYLALFATVGIVFLLVNLLVVGRFVRPQNPHPEKLETLRVRRAGGGHEFRAVRLAVLRGGVAVHHL